MRGENPRACPYLDVQAMSEQPPYHRPGTAVRRAFVGSGCECQNRNADNEQTHHQRVVLIAFLLAGWRVRG